jgi:hypothetical protein
MALRALGVPEAECSPARVNKVVGAMPLQGAAWEPMLAAANHYGMRATLTLPSTVRQLKSWTDAGKPVVIAWNPEGREWSHASLVFDVDDDLNVYVADPNIPDPDETVRVVPKGEFYQKWYEKAPQGFLIRRPACVIEREITPDGRQVMASSKKSVGSASRVASRYAKVSLGDAALWSGRRKPTPAEVDATLNSSWQDWTPHPLPDDLYRFFKRVPGAVEVSLDDLTPIRAREKGIANANRFMWLAYWGEMDRRKPISLRDNGDGTYTVLDGNSTFANAQMSGWGSILGKVEE